MQVAALLVRRDPTAFPAAVRAAIRDVLRVGGYKPSGRGKPASEFLHAVACEQGLPIVNNLVDINNLVSLGTALPISTFDADKLDTPVVVRFGRPGERCIFNASGQSMDVSGIPVICLAASDEPVGNAVKDSMLDCCDIGRDLPGILAAARGRFAWAMGYTVEVPWIESLIMNLGFMKYILRGREVPISVGKGGVRVRTRSTRTCSAEQAARWILDDFGIAKTMGLWAMNAR
jgi:hypothetical protein